MAPIPTTGSLLYQEASELNAKLLLRLNDAVTFQLPRLRDCKVLPEQQLWGTELREEITGLARGAEDLVLLAEDLGPGNARSEVASWASELTKQINQLRKDNREALLTSKRAIDAQLRSERDELLRATTSANAPRVPKIEGAAEDSLMKANNDVTEALRRTTRLMQQELERSVLSSQMLDESSQTLRSTSDLYTSFTSLLDTSKILVTALERSDWLDRLILLAALTFFFVSVGWVLKRRILDRGLGLVMWTFGWTKWLPGLSDDMDFEKSLLRTSSIVVASVSSIVVTASSITSSSLVSTSQATKASVIESVSLTSLVDTVLPTAASTTLYEPTFEIDELGEEVDSDIQSSLDSDDAPVESLTEEPDVPRKSIPARDEL